MTGFQPLPLTSQGYLCLMISVRKSSLYTVSFYPAKRRGFSQGQSDEPVPIIIIFLEHISHPLQTDATLHEEIETNSVLSPLIICSEKRFNELRTEPVSECYQRICVFVETDVSTSVCVESIEE